MFAVENVRFVDISDTDNVTVQALNRMNKLIPTGRFFNRCFYGDGLSFTHLFIKAPGSFEAFIKTTPNVQGLAKYGSHSALRSIKKVNRNKFGGLYWNRRREKLYVMYDGRTIPWYNWVRWCTTTKKPQTVMA